MDKQYLEKENGTITIYSWEWHSIFSNRNIKALRCLFMDFNLHISLHSARQLPTRKIGTISIFIVRVKFVEVIADEILSPWTYFCFGMVIICLLFRSKWLPFLELFKIWLFTDFVICIMFGTTDFNFKTRQRVCSFCKTGLCVQLCPCPDFKVHYTCVKTLNLDIQIRNFTRLEL